MRFIRKLLAYLRKLWHTGIMVESTKVMPVQRPKEWRFRKNIILKNTQAVVGHRIREVTLEVDADEVQVVVLEIVECAEMVHNQNRPAG